MSKLYCVFFILLILFSVSIADYNLKSRTDLEVSDWGPFSDKYIGLSHVTDKQNGYRFDFTIFPGYYQRKVNIPRVLWESGYHPWLASPNLDYYSYRFEVEWKDRVYCDVSFSKIDENARFVRTECINNTDESQGILLHLMSSMNFPYLKKYSNDVMSLTKMDLPGKSIWINAVDYDDMSFATPRPTDDLVYDGYLCGEKRVSNSVSGSVLAKGFGKDKGDKATYSFELKEDIINASLVFRYNMINEKALTLVVGKFIKKKINFIGTGKFSLQDFTIGKIEKGKHKIAIISQGGAKIELDGFAIVSSNEVKKIKMLSLDLNPVPQISDGPITNSVILKYDVSDNYYGLAWDFDQFDIKELYCEYFDDLLLKGRQNIVAKVRRSKGNGHYSNVIFEPISLYPNSKKVINNIVCCGTKKQVEKYLNNFYINKNDYIKTSKSSEDKIAKNNHNSAGEKYQFGHHRMTATTLTNMLFPIYTQNSYIKTYTPERMYGLYTWDAGFIGIGLAELDIERSVDCLNQYVMDPNSQSAFLHHGTPLPIQIYQFLEIWNQTQSQELLEHFYPGLKRYYQFISGSYGSSNTNSHKSNLLQTWDYFYNSGGWDDYPPQNYVHDNKLTNTATPVVTTSHAIRFARIMKMAATSLNKKDDIKQFEKDIKIFSDALQKYSWDKESGYFGYVNHDKNGTSEGILKTENGVNLNMGLGGISPLVAGVFDDNQEKIMISHLMSEGKIWSDVGLSTVDQSAPYYKNDGYWNGSVWLPHQWFFWKTMLDLGYSDHAHKIAKTGLDVWKRETEYSYNCFEHFCIENGRGTGGNHFGGLSTPVLAWYNAYFKPGKITCGLDVWIVKKTFSDDKSRFFAQLKMFHQKKKGYTTVLVGMIEGQEYKVTWNNKNIDFEEIYQGTIQVEIPVSDEKGVLEIKTL